MKSLLFFTLTLVSFSSFAGTTCLDLLALNKSNYMGLHDLETIPGASVSDSSGPAYADSLFGTQEMIDLIGEFEEESCEGAITSKTVSLVNSGTLEFIYTIEDRCDGGNSYGYVTDESQKVVGVITDSDITCFID